MKKLIALILLLSLFSCDKDEPKTLTQNEEILNAITGKWQFSEFWNTKYGPLNYTDYDYDDFINRASNTFEFKEDCTYHYTSNKNSATYDNVYKFKLTGDDERTLEFEDWKFLFFVLAPSYDEGYYHVNVQIKKIIIEESTKDYLIIRADEIFPDGSKGPIFAKLKRVK